MNSVFMQKMQLG
uniref:Uncharacterized protein n=1 Tax=Anguilla anguilla TaxID=7936 RepID=A0A0E9PDT2_ANGAN